MPPCTNKKRAHAHVLLALRRGLLVRQPCVECGDDKSHAHHPDYRKPLDVIWLCLEHHWELHGQKYTDEDRLAQRGDERLIQSLAQYLPLGTTSYKAIEKARIDGMETK